MCVCRLIYTISEANMNVLLEQVVYCAKILGMRVAKSIILEDFRNFWRKKGVWADRPIFVYLLIYAPEVQARLPRSLLVKGHYISQTGSPGGTDFALRMIPTSCWGEDVL